MNRNDTERLWAQVQLLLRAPPAAGDVELRRAARMLASMREDAVELLLAQWLAQTRWAPAGPLPSGPDAADAAAVAQGASTRPARGMGLRGAALVSAAGIAGVAAGAVGHAALAGALDDDLGVDLG